MTTDEICLEVYRSGFVSVDFVMGRIHLVRYGNREAGCLNCRGYRVMTLHFNGIRRQVKCHRLIWVAANGIPPKGEVIDHINRIKSDNRLSNLRSVSECRNANNRRSYNGEDNPSAVVNYLVASHIRLDYEVQKSYKKLAEKYGVSKTTIANIIRGETWNESVS